MRLGQFFASLTFFKEGYERLAAALWEGMDTMGPIFKATSVDQYLHCGGVAFQDKEPNKLTFCPW